MSEQERSQLELELELEPAQVLLAKDPRKKEETTLQTKPTKESKIEHDCLGAADFVNMRIAKTFDKKAYLGTVTRYIEPNMTGPSPAFWYVRYDDGDSEDLTYGGIIKGIKLYAKRSTSCTKNGSKRKRVVERREEQLEHEVEKLRKKQKKTDQIIQEMVDSMRSPIGLGFNNNPVAVPFSAKYFDHGEIVGYFKSRNACPFSLVKSPENSTLIPATYSHFGGQYCLMLHRLIDTGCVAVDSDLQKWLDINELQKKAVKKDVSAIMQLAHFYSESHYEADIKRGMDLYEVMYTMANDERARASTTLKVSNKHYVIAATMSGRNMIKKNCRVAEGYSRLYAAAGAKKDEVDMAAHVIGKGRLIGNIHLTKDVREAAILFHNVVVGKCKFQLCSKEQVNEAKKFLDEAEREIIRMECKPPPQEGDPSPVVEELYESRHTPVDADNFIS